MRARKTTEDERALFRTVIAEQRPLKAVMPPVTPKKKRAPAKPAHTLDGHTLTRARQGKLVPDAGIDLHGQTEATAHRNLHAFLARAQRDGARLALVITGKGNPRREDGFMTGPHGVLKQMVPRWLGEAPFAGLVSGSGAAHIRHGGEGALYVYLRKMR